MPILQTLSEDPYGIYALVLTPTRLVLFRVLAFRTDLLLHVYQDTTNHITYRSALYNTCSELAFQIGDQFVIFGKPLNIKVSVVTGGRSKSLQNCQLQFITWMLPKLAVLCIFP